MPIFKLTPHALANSDWRASTWQAPAIIRAPTESDARAAASEAFGIAVERGTKHRPAVNPWRQPHLVTCEQFTTADFSENGGIEILEPRDH